MTEWERFNEAMKSIMSVPPETAEAIRRKGPKGQAPRAGQPDEPAEGRKRGRRRD